MNSAQRSFSAGELAPSLYARTDLAKYTTGLRTCRNFICLREGGITNRPGTHYVANLPASTTRLIPFVYNADQACVLAFSGGLIQVFVDGADTGIAIPAPYVEDDVFAIRYSQTADVLTLTHEDYPVYELRRTSASAWSLLSVSFGPGIIAPTGLSTTSGYATLLFVNWVVTAVNADGAESYASNPVGIIATLLFPKSHTPRTLVWDAVTGAVEYNIYKGYQSSGTGDPGTFGFVGTTRGATFFDDGKTPDFESQPPVSITTFAVAGEYPGAVGGYQQRRFFAGSTNRPETFWASRTADLSNISETVPLQDDDAIEATLVGSKVNAIRHIVDADVLFVLTGGGEWVLRGGNDGTILPTAIGALNFSKHGSALVPPIVIDRRVLFLQARQAIVRQIVSNDVGPGYLGANLTLLSTHLFKGKTIVDWSYAEEPHSIIWCVRSDGVLLGLTDLEEQSVLAWHRHDTDGLVESVCAIPEGDEDRLYLVVNRDGVRMLERMASRYSANQLDACFSDSSLVYDGRNTGSETMTLSGSSSWAYDEKVTVTRSGGGFTLQEIGNRIDFPVDSAPNLEVRLTEYVSATVMRGFPDRTIPAALRTTATTAWTRAVDVVSGLTHLEGLDVSVIGDATVVASPNNPGVALTVTVSGGTVTLPEPYGVITVGLPYICDAETLDIDSPSGQSIKDRKIKVNHVTAYVEASRDFFTGQSIPTGDDLLEFMDESSMRTATDDYGLQELLTDTVDVIIPTNWNSNGRVAIRHIDPSPLTILALIPRGEIG